LTLSKIVSIQDSASTVRVNTFLSYSKCAECPLPALMHSLNLLLKLGTALLIEPVENCPISSPEWLSIQKLLLSSD